MMRLKGRDLAIAGLAMFAVSAAPLSGQSKLPPGSELERLPRIGVGYVTNAPQIFSGLSAYVALPVFGGLGLYVDGKFDLATPGDEEDFAGNLTVAEVEETPGQIFRRDEAGWWSVNAALLRPLSPELMVYLGGGYANETRYRRYQDSQGNVEEAVFGWYWIEDPANSGARINFLGGVFFRLGSRIALQVGLESQPSGATIGASYSLPLR